MSGTFRLRRVLANPHRGGNDLAGGKKNRTFSPFFLSISNFGKSPRFFRGEGMRSFRIGYSSGLKSTTTHVKEGSLFFLRTIS